MTARVFSGAEQGALLVVLALLMLALLMLASLLLGAGEIGPADSLRYLLGLAAPAQLPQDMAMVMWQMRLPRMLAAVLVGGALGMAGMLLQTVTRNPLAEPGLLGVNAGAALGVVIGIACAGADVGAGYLLWALLGATLGNGCVLLATRLDQYVDAPLRLVLAGAALSATFHGLTSSILLAQQSGYDQYRFWIMGSLSGISPAALGWVAPAIVTGAALALLLSRALAALQLGDDSACALGHRPALVRTGIACAATLLTGSAVALAGPIAFLGLLAPFLARQCKCTTPAARLLLAALFGMALLLAADIAARLLARPFETPASVVTALLGAPLLVWIARRSSREGLA
ncbi:iron complex transport system permease protein [Andreprevotia lacus DSM 23236]|jgi:iron complex transport system permease protein|uniref:Iron complex transport system permease protein n=1 Tax=Andreprevotia lacus DSM 23236 TaxID=1121001 RepID=A0A1W1XPY0_9NEIS|nr:iron ABC transporter permease [Andreprevotia lacus]SMC25905.1 iron complex transport system permease protein [Andreprevotia lacus DSM 23236]